MTHKKVKEQALAKKRWLYLLRFRSVILELFIVFVGVYGAFYLNNYNQKKIEQENRQKVLGALSEEISHLGRTFAGISTYQTKFNKEVEEKFQQNVPLPEVERLRYAAPQYSLEVLENALRFNTFELLDLPLHIQLSRFYSDIQKLIDTEKKITEVSQNYVFLENAGPEARRQQNKWSLIYLNDRRDILSRLAEASSKIVNEIQKRVQLEKS